MNIFILYYFFKKVIKFMKTGNAFDFFIINFKNMKFFGLHIARKNIWSLLIIYKGFFFFLH